jgi:succinate dehydrogenase/fumarate reductase flavoprotein subunit
MLKKIFIGLAAVVVSSAALAHDGRGYEHYRYDHHERYEHRADRFEDRWHRPVVVEHAPRVVYAPQPVVTQPRGWASIDLHLPW